MRNLLLLFLVFSLNKAISQTDMPPNAEVGKCYAKCLIPPTYDTFEVQFPVFLGELPNMDIKWERIILNPERKYGGIYTEEEFVELPIVRRFKMIDTSMIDWQTYTIIEEAWPGGNTEWKEVVCDSDITSDLVRRLQDALRFRGYDPGPLDNILGSETKKALKRFQMYNGLPIGDINIETMEALGLSY